MKRRNVFPLLLLTLAVCLSGCSGSNEKNIQRSIGQELKADISAGTVVTEEDSHGGFHGDGITYVVIQFDDDSFETSISGAENWKPFPLDETAQALVYGCVFTDGQYGPYLTDEEGDPLIPKVETGYYWLKDWQADDGAQTGGADILHRASLNFTLAVYDSDCNTLYYCKMDT